MSVFRMSPACAIALAAGALILAAAAPARAADWHKVISGKTETIEIDKAHVSRGTGGTTAWSRINLGREVNDPAGAYDSIHAQNLYDCDAHRFTTLRRAYFKGDTLVREESVARQRANRAEVGSIDERLLNEACRARTISEAPDVAAAAGRAAAQTDEPERPSAMHADMRTLAENGPVRRVPVSDAVSKPVGPAGAVPAAPAAAATAAPTPSGERPRHIILPPIDKAAADREAASAGQKSAGPVAAKPESRPEAKPAAKASSHAAPAPTESAEERRVRELQYATSGPRKSARRKPAAEHAAANPVVHLQAHWAYEGEGGPANWAKLNSDYATCASGRRQSPIDIRDGIKLGLEPIRFDYKPTQVRIVDNGHTLQVNVGEGLALQIMGKRYELIQFHFHRPSEERVNGRLYDMVVHLVHRNDEGQLAVVAVLLEKGGEHPLIQTVWNNMPLERDMEVTPAEAIDPTQLLPENRNYWTYMGSLTTPPCSEGVLWMVLKQPVQVSADQVAIFSRLYRNNARPVQPSNGRLIKESR